MLTITVPKVDLFDEAKNEFVVLPETKIDLEHSLASLSKWESKWKIPFLSDTEKTDEQTLDYIKSMTITPGISDQIYDHFNQENLNQVSEYINDKMTATWFSEKPKGQKSREIITSELIYYWMVSLTIPFECQDWHLNRLLTLIKVCNHKNQPAKKMGKSEIAQRNRSLNEQRRAQMQSRG